MLSAPHKKRKYYPRLQAEKNEIPDKYRRARSQIHPQEVASDAVLSLLSYG
jgi:hypothetical protein